MYAHVHAHTHMFGPEQVIGEHDTHLNELLQDETFRHREGTKLPALQTTVRRRAIESSRKSGR